MLAADHDVAAELWSAPSYKALREDALAVERWNRLHPTEEPRTPFVTDALSTAQGPVVAVTDFMKAVPDQVARWVPRERPSVTRRRGSTPAERRGHGGRRTVASLRSPLV